MRCAAAQVAMTVATAVAAVAVAVATAAAGGEALRRVDDGPGRNSRVQTAQAVL
jgi:hypothetical protein